MRVLSCIRFTALHLMAEWKVTNFVKKCEFAKLHNSPPAVIFFLRLFVCFVCLLVWFFFFFLSFFKSLVRCELILLVYVHKMFMFILENVIIICSEQQRDWNKELGRKRRKTGCVWHFEFVLLSAYVKLKEFKVWVWTWLKNNYGIKAKHCD